MAVSLPARAHRVTVFGLTRNSWATSEGVSRASGASGSSVWAMARSFCAGMGARPGEGAGWARGTRTPVVYESSANLRPPLPQGSGWSSLVGEAEVGSRDEGQVREAALGRHRRAGPAPVDHRDEAHRLGSRLPHDVGRLQHGDPPGDRVLGDGHAVAGLQRPRDATAGAVVLHLLAHAEAAQ